MVGHDAATRVVKPGGSLVPRRPDRSPPLKFVRFAGRKRRKNENRAKTDNFSRQKPTKFYDSRIPEVKGSLVSADY